MFQDIEPYQYRCEFENRDPTEDDYLIIFKSDEILLKNQAGKFELPRCSNVSKVSITAVQNAIYLFSINKIAFFLSPEKLPEAHGFKYHGIQIFRRLEPRWLAFAGATAAHLAIWYNNNRFCGKCGKEQQHAENERLLFCPDCETLEYPKISPVVLVAITNGDRILLTRAASGKSKKYSLVAGYVEIGETLEAAVRREVMEEVGLRIKNICYHRSQPWAFSSSILTGFFAELDGSDKITLDLDELSEAKWVSREDIPNEDSSFSLTWNMIETFRQS